MYVCTASGCPLLVSQPGRCPPCRRDADKARGSRHERGYDSQHVATRAASLEDAYGTRCHLCHQYMYPHQSLALDHTIDRSGYRGITHLSCNSRDGAQRGNPLRT